MVDCVEEQAADKLPTAAERRGETLCAPRRRLVKGVVLAMPAVMTLRGGAALAAVSMTCQEKDALKDPQPVVNVPDEWVRIEDPAGTYKLAHVDDDGRIVGVADNSSMGQQLTWSCYASAFGDVEPTSVESTNSRKGKNTMLWIEPTDVESTTERSGKNSFW